MRQAAGGNSSPNSSMSKWRVRPGASRPGASRSASLPPARLAGGVLRPPSTESHVHPSHVLVGEGGERGTRGQRVPALFLWSRFQCADRLHIIVAAGGAECCDHCAAKPAVQTANVAAVVKSILRGLRCLNSNDDRVRFFDPVFWRVFCFFGLGCFGIGIFWRQPAIAYSAWRPMRPPRIPLRGRLPCP